MDSLKYFMWGYQPQFQLSAKALAEQVFGALDAKLLPNVFLVGVLYKNHVDRHPVFIEPEGCGYDPELFSDVLTDSRRLEAFDEGFQIDNRQTNSNESHKKRNEIRALRNAIQRVARRRDRYRGVVTFCSWPVEVEVEGFMVCTALQLREDVFNAYYSLSRNRARHDRCPIATSLLDAVVYEYLTTCSESLRKFISGERIRTLSRNAEEVIRSAVVNLMRTPVLAGQFAGANGLFQACNLISSMRGKELKGIGQMLISGPEHPNIETQIRLESPIPLEDYRTVNKLLEISSEGQSLLTDSVLVHGIGRLSGTYDQKMEDLFIVNFNKVFNWELLHAEHRLMRVTNGIPRLPRLPIQERKFKSDVRRIFSGIDYEQVNGLWKLTLEIINQKHAITIIVSAKANEEARQLPNQGIVIKPVKLTSDIIPVVIPIDGAILIDKNGICYAIGLFLGEHAVDNEVLSRDAGYSFAVKYIERSGGECLAIVVSEDGMVDLVPDLLPQIKSSWISEVIAQLHGVYDSSSYDYKAYNRAMTWISRHRYYLSPGQIKETNQLIREIKTRFKGEITLGMFGEELISETVINGSYFLS